MMKRLFSALLCLFMLCTLLPAAALANGDDPLPVAPHCDWQGARVTVAGETVAYTLDVYNNKLTDQQVWLALTAEKDDQTMLLSFKNVSKSTYAYIYSAATLESGAPTTGNYSARFSFSGAYTGKWKAPYAGVYYMLLIPSSSSNITDTAAAVTYTLEDGDLNEPNDAPATATELTENVSTYFTLTGFNDADWFKITTAVPGEAIKLYLSNFDYTVPTIGARLFRESDCAGGTAPADGKAVWSMNFSGNGSGAYKVNEPGTYYLKLSNKDNNNGSERPLRLRYELLPGDAQEFNDSRETAFPVPFDYPVEFTLNGDNDADWFCFETTQEGEIVTLELSGFETDYSNKLSYYIYNATYDGLTGEITGIGSTVYSGTGINITHSKQMSFATPGAHFLHIVPYDRAITENALRLVLRTYAVPDSQEPNNTYAEATLLLEGEPTTFNLPLGDKDWFRFTADAPNQTLELRLTIPAGGSVYTYLYSGAAFEASGNNAPSMTYWNNSGSGVTTYRYMLGAAGDYYVQLLPYSSSRVFDADGTVTYNLIAPDDSERNNGWKSAATLDEGIAVSFTLPAWNDSDWFRIVTDTPNQTLELTLNIPDGGSVDTKFYSGADFETNGDSASSMTGWTGSGSGVKTYRYMLGDAGDYYVRLTPYSSSRVFDADATASYRLIAPDANERNNGYAGATELPAQTAASFTIPATNDYDWFHVGNLTAGDKLTVTGGGMSGKFPGTLLCKLYYLDEYETSAQSCASCSFSKAGSCTFSIERDSNYFICFSHYSGTIFDNALWFRYAVTAQDKPVTGIRSITNGARTIFETQTLQLYANIDPANATNQNVTWVSSNPAVATIDADGLVTGVTAGSTTITATSVDGGYTAETVITVVEPIPVTGVSIRAEQNPSGKGSSAGNPYYLALDTGLQLTALVEPAGATELGVVWSVTDEDVLAVNEYGKVFAVGSGAACAVATTVDGGFTANFYFNVPDETYPVRGISLSENAKTLYLGEAGFTLTAKVSPSYATNPSVVWTSSNEAVATVDENGVVTPVAEGYVDITAFAQENAAISAVCTVKVNPPRTRVTGISFAETELHLGLYGTAQLQPVIAPADATDKSVKWTTNNKTIVSVSRTGVVVGLNLGSAVITATTTDGEFLASVTVYVSSNAPLGDVNNDGAVDAGDALLILRYSVGLIALSDAQKAVADVNGDGEIDAGDAVLMLRYDAGLIDEFPKKN